MPDARTFADAFLIPWNAHDVDASLATLTDDATWEFTVGADPWGTAYRGREELRSALVGLFTTIPDIEYRLLQAWSGEGFVVMEVGVTGTLADGTRLDYNACDVCRLEGDRVSSKSSYRKVVTPRTDAPGAAPVRPVGVAMPTEPSVPQADRTSPDRGGASRPAGQGTKAGGEAGVMHFLDGEVRALIEYARLCYVATVTPDGRPSVSPKGSLIVVDACHLAFADMASPNTVRNLLANPNVEVNVVDPVSRRGYRFAGTAEISNDPDLVKRVGSGLGHEYPVRQAVLIRVTSVRLLESPVYLFTDASEDEVRRMWLAKYGYGQPAIADAAR